MTFFFEISKPFNFKWYLHNGRISFRITWFWFAFGIVKVPWHEFVMTSYAWKYDGKYYETLKELELIK